MIIGVYVGLCLLGYLFQGKLLYQPRRGLEGKPSEILLAYEDVSFETTDGLTLHGWWVPADNAAATIIFCHGNAGNISHRLESIRIFNRIGLNTFIFDYRGYGESDGSPDETGTYLDADAAWRYVTGTRKVAPERLFVGGRSLGGAIAAHLAWKQSPCGVILESTFTSLPDLAAELYPFLPVRVLSKFEYDTKAIINDIRCPLLIVHSPEDDLIPFSHARELMEARRGPKDLLEIQGDHNYGWLDSGKGYTDGLSRFITKALARD